MARNLLSHLLCVCLSIHSLPFIAFAGKHQPVWASHIIPASFDLTLHFSYASVCPPDKAVRAALVCLGTWPAIFNLLERRGRRPSHTFLDYSITNYIVAIIIALTLGQIGNSSEEKPNFTTQLKEVRNRAMSL